jgi:hypothetical protein
LGRLVYILFVSMNHCGIRVKIIKELLFTDYIFILFKIDFFKIYDISPTKKKDMGQKSKNAGKKQSKTCSELATAKSFQILGCSRRNKQIVNSITKTNPEDGTYTRIIDGRNNVKTRFKSNKIIITIDTQSYKYNN